MNLERLESLEKWLDGLGTNKSDRIHRAIDTLRKQFYGKLLPNPISDAELEAMQNEPWNGSKVRCSQLDVIEFLDIFDAFRSEPIELIGPKVLRASSGPFEPVNENSENADARNMQFELSLAAEWRLNGLSVTIGEPDFSLSAGPATFIIECKRPFSEASIRSNIRHAKNQLENHLDKNPNAFGAVAISVTRIVVPPEFMIISPSLLPSIQRNPGRYMRALIEERKEWGLPFELLGLKYQREIGPKMEALAKRTRFRNFDFHDRIVGIFFHAAPSFAHSSGISGRLAVSMISPIANPGPAYTYLESATSEAYSRGWPRTCRFTKPPGDRRG